MEDRNIAHNKSKTRHRRNHEIRVPEVRVIDAEGEQVGIVERDKALALAEEAGLDLVEIQPNAEPPVCRIMDFGRFRFEAQKKAQAARKKQKQTELKEVKFRPNTDSGDYAIKMRNVRRFLEDGNKVKVTIRFRGREMAHQELGRDLAKRVEEDLGDEGTVEQYPRQEGRLLTMMIGPPKRKS